MNVQDRSERPKRSSTQARHQALHDRLVTAAEAEIVGVGLTNLRARSLADTVGCSVGAIYGVFPDLDALVLAVHGRTLDQIETALRTAGAGKTPADHLNRLAAAYLDYAATHRNRWRALFEHRMPAGHAIPAWYAERQAGAFAQIEGPLRALQPQMKERQAMVLARTVFAAVHGMVDLGLDEKVAEMPMALLRAQVRLVVAAMARGLA